MKSESTALAALGLCATLVETPDGVLPLQIVFSQQGEPILLVSVWTRDEASVLIATMLEQLTLH